MTLETINGNRILTADEGYFLRSLVNSGLYGKAMSLASDDSEENYEELPMSEYPSESAIDIYEWVNPELVPYMEEKIAEIEAYDVSDNVNGFYYNGRFMWLDKLTRVGLVNTIESAVMCGVTSIPIWYRDAFCVTLDCNDAKQLLARLEMYAMQCYNVTAQHKRNVLALTTVRDIENYDVTTGYPQKLNF